MTNTIKSCKLKEYAEFHKDPDGYWVEFPDLDGCFSQGDTITEIYYNAKEALELYCTGMVAIEECLPEPRDIFTLDVPENCFTSLGEAYIQIKKANI